MRGQVLFDACFQGLGYLLLSGACAVGEELRFPVVRYEDGLGYGRRHVALQEDARGEGPWIESESDPGTLEENPDWTATYDLNAAAADLWEEKAANHAANFDFSADGGSYSRSQAYDQHMTQARYFRSRRSVKTITMRPEPLMQGEEEIDD